MSDAITMSVRMQMASLAAKMGPRELGATGGLLAAVTLYWAGAPIQEVQALEKKPYPEHVPGKTAKLHRRPSWEAKFTGSEEQGRAFATASTVFDAAAKTRLHRRPWSATLSFFSPLRSGTRGRMGGWRIFKNRIS